MILRDQTWRRQKPADSSLTPYEPGFPITLTLCEQLQASEGMAQLSSSRPEGASASIGFAQSSDCQQTSRRQSIHHGLVQPFIPEVETQQ